MKDLASVLEGIRTAKARGSAWCLATLVRVTGSAYRRPGARMLVTEDGARAGALSGGCLEGEIAEQSMLAIRAKHPRVIVLNEEFDATSEHFGTGCDGRIHVLLEPATQNHDPSILVAEAAEARRTCVLVTAVSGDGADGTIGAYTARVDMANATSLSGLLPDHPGLGYMLSRYAARALDRKQSETLTLETSDSWLHVLFEFFEPGIQLIVLGDGHDVRHVLSIGAELGWTPAVVGRRPLSDLQKSLPLATQWHFVMHPEQVLDHVRPDPSTAVAIMSHNYERDRAYLRAVLETGCFYIGMLGPRRRTERMARELGRPQIVDDPRLHAPLGLDIGAETPEEIALSLAAEVQAHFRQRTGDRLRSRGGPIHAPVPSHVLQRQSSHTP